MSRKSKLELLSKDISSFLNQCNKGAPTSTILNNNLKELKTVYDKVPTIKKLIDDLSSSNFLDDIIEQDNFFNENYFKYLEQSTSCNPVPNTVSDIDSFYQSNKTDPYFSFKDIYYYIFSEKSETAKKAYSLYYEESIKKYFSKGKYQTYCSVCQQQICVGTRDLDHFLPQSYFPILCLRHFNIVPMCTICNRIYKRDKLPAIPVIHPYKVDFPIKKIPIYLKDLKELEIQKHGLPNEYLNYIKYMSLDERLHHEDMGVIVENILKEIEQKAEGEIRADLVKNKKIENIREILKEVIEGYKISILSHKEPYQFIKLKILEFLLQSEDYKRFVLTLYQKYYIK